jgi:pimeloyl-ACP methyl ester carboxylesterase
MAYVSAGEVRLHVQRLPARAADPSGAAPVVVFVHGAFIDSMASFYFTLGPAFAAAGYEVVLFDLRGHGRSSRPEHGYRVEDFTADLDAMLDGLAITAPVHLIGNSFGGTVALDFAVHHPRRTASVLVIESGPATASWSANMRAALRQATETLAADRALAWFVEQYGTHSSTRTGDPHHDAHIARLGLAAGRLIGSTAIARELPDSRRLTEEQLRAVGCPVLLLNGGEGLVAADSARLAALVPGARIAEVPGQKHSVLVEAPDAVRTLALDWLDGHARRVPAGGGAR